MLPHRAPTSQRLPLRSGVRPTVRRVWTFDQLHFGGRTGRLHQRTSVVPAPAARGVTAIATPTPRAQRLHRCGSRRLTSVPGARPRTGDERSRGGSRCGAAAGPGQHRVDRNDATGRWSIGCDPGGGVAGRCGGSQRCDRDVVDRLRSQRARNGRAGCQPRSGTNTAIPSGGRVRSSEAGRPTTSTSAASTTPFTAPVPPKRSSSELNTSRHRPPSGTPIR